MTFSILFWNIWLDNQVNGESNATHLLDELERLVNQYEPDCIGLEEVLQASQSKTPFVTDFLKERCGYMYNRYAPASPLNDDWFVGAALCSRLKMHDVRDIAISNDSPAQRDGYEGFKVKAIAATLELSKKHNLKVIVAHPMHLRTYTLKDHYDATKKLEQLIRSDEFSKDTILGGDFNEPGFMPKAFKAKMGDVLHFRTGTRLSPTWRHNGYPLTPIRANLDQLYWTKNSEFSLINFEVLSSRVSDHKPLLATFRYPGEI